MIIIWQSRCSCHCWVFSAFQMFSVNCWISATHLRFFIIKASLYKGNFSRYTFAALLIKQILKNTQWMCLKRRNNKEIVTSDELTLDSKAH